MSEDKSRGGKNLPVAFLKKKWGSHKFKREYNNQQLLPHCSYNHSSIERKQHRPVLHKTKRFSSCYNHITIRLDIRWKKEREKEEDKGREGRRAERKRETHTQREKSNVHLNVKKGTWTVKPLVYPWRILDQPKCPKEWKKSPWMWLCRHWLSRTHHHCRHWTSRFLNRWWLQEHLHSWK